MIKIDYTNGQGIATSAYARYCDVPNDYSNIDSFNNLFSCDFLTVDGNGIDLSGTKQFANNNVYQGVVSNEISAGQNYTYEAYIEYTGDFSDLRQTGLTITFYHTVIKTLGVKLYHDDLQIGVAYSVDEPRVSKFVSFTNIDTTNCNKIRIFNMIAQQPNSRFYIENVAKGKVTKGTFDGIKSHNLIEEINILSTDLPINQFEAVVISQEKPAIDSKIAIYSNDNYYGTFWINDVEQIAKHTEYTIDNNGETETIVVGSDLYSITAVNSVALLDRGTFRKWRSTVWYNPNVPTLWEAWSGVRFADVVNDIKNNAGAVVDLIDTSDINSLGIYGYIDRKSYRHNLCACSFALGYMIDGSRSNKINLRKIPTTVSKVYTDTDIIGDATFVKNPKITSVEYYTYPTTTVQQIGDITISGSANPYSKENTYWFTLPSTNGNNKIHDYDLSAIWIENKGSPVGTFDVNADRAEYKTYSKTEWLRFPLEVNPTVKIISIQRASEDNVEQYNYFTVQGVKNIVTKSGDTIYWANYENAFTGTLIDRTTEITKMARSGGKVNAKVILTDEKVGDLVTIPTKFGDSITGIITKMSVHFGFRDIADIEVTEYE